MSTIEPARLPVVRVHAAHKRHANDPIKSETDNRVAKPGAPLFICASASRDQRCSHDYRAAYPMDADTKPNGADDARKRRGGGGNAALAAPLTNVLLLPAAASRWR